MARTFVRQVNQIRNSESYDDSVTPSQSNYEIFTGSLENDLNNLRSQIQNAFNRDGASFPTGNWWSDLSAPNTFELGTQRGINALNQDLHDVERKRVLTRYTSFVDVFVSSSQNYAVLSFSELPTPDLPNTYIVASGSLSILTGTVAASASIGAHTLNEVPGDNPVNPKNLCLVVTASNRTPIISEGRLVFALFQTDKTDGQSLTGGDAQLSFVRFNSTGDDLEAVPVSDVQGKYINYSSVTRKAFDDTQEQSFLLGVDTSSTTILSGTTNYVAKFTTPSSVGDSSIYDDGSNVGIGTSSPVAQLDVRSGQNAVLIG